MASQLQEQQECPSCGMDLSKIRDVVEDGSLTFCLKCQFPLVLIAGKYRLESVLRKGGCSIVYVAKHVHLDRDPERVIKIIRPEFFTIKGMATRFRREVQLTSALSHQNEHIVRIFDDFGEIPNIGHFYVMEYLQGSPLSSMLKDPALLPSLSFCYHLFIQLCETMQFAHEQGVVHRDLKPDNLMLVKRKKDPYFLKVLDFGIAKPVSTEELPGTHITQGSLGTPAYMAPEQCLNQPTDARTDIYAMGIILYELLTGRTPFLPPQGEHSAYTSVVGVIEGQITTAPPSPHELRPDRVSASMEKMLLKALAKKQYDRYQSIDELRDAFLAEVSSTPAFRKEGGSYSMDRGGEIPQAFPAPREGLSTGELEMLFMSPEQAATEDNAEATLIYGGSSLEPVVTLDQQKASPADEAPEAVLLSPVSLDEDDDDDEPLLLSPAAPATPAASDEVPLLLDVPKETPPPASAKPETPIEELPPVKQGPAVGETLMFSRQQSDVALYSTARRTAPAKAPAPSEPPTDEKAGASSLDPTGQETAAYSSFSAAILDGGLSVADALEGPRTLDDMEGVSVAEELRQGEAMTVPEVAAAPASGATSEAQGKPAPSAEATDAPVAPTDQASLMSIVDRIQGPRDGRVSLFLVQHKPWDEDPFLVKSIRDKITQLQQFLKSDAFRTLYPGCRGKIVVEALTFPQEVAKGLMREFVELRLLPKRGKAAKANGHPAPAAKVPAAKAPIAKAPAVKVPAAKAPAAKEAPGRPPAAAGTPMPVSKAPAPANGPVMQAATPSVRQVSGGLAAPLPAPRTQTPPGTFAPTSPVNSTTLPEHDVNRGPTPMAIWDRLDEHEPVFLTPQQGLSPAMMGAGALLLVALVGVIYALMGIGSVPDPAENLRILQPDQISSVTQPKISYARVTLRPDRATFALIPVQDRKSGSTEVFVLFASRENRRLLIYAPQEQSQLLKRLRQKDTSDGTQMIPVWKSDLQGKAQLPEARTYTGALEALQRRKNGPLELVLPDQNRNVNKIPGFVRAGIQFPMDSMILLVGQKPKPAPQHHTSILWMSLLLALAAGGAFVGMHRRQQRAF